MSLLVWMMFLWPGLSGRGLLRLHLLAYQFSGGPLLFGGLILGRGAASVS